MDFFTQAQRQEEKEIFCFTTEARRTQRVYIFFYPIGRRQLDKRNYPFGEFKPICPAPQAENFLFDVVSRQTKNTISFLRVLCASVVNPSFCSLIH